MSTGWERLVLPAKGVVVEPWYVSESSNVRSNSNPEISVEAIKGIIRSAAVKYDVFPPAEEIDQFTTLIIDRIEKEKPEDPFKYAEEEVDKWFRANKLRWVREIRPERIRTAPPEKAKTVYGRWKELVESAEFKRLAEVVG